MAWVSQRRLDEIEARIAKLSTDLSTSRSETVRAELEDFRAAVTMWQRTIRRELQRLWGAHGHSLRGSGSATPDESALEDDLEAQLALQRAAPVRPGEG